MQRLLGLCPSSIRAARQKRAFPASWFKIIKAECDRLGIECPMSLFSFREPVCDPVCDPGVDAATGASAHVPIPSDSGVSQKVSGGAV